METNAKKTYHFDQLSILDTLYDHLKPLIYSSMPVQDDLIKKTSRLLIDTFISWYRSLSFYSVLTKDLNQYILKARWSRYVLFVACQFLSTKYNCMNLISHNECFQRLKEYRCDEIYGSAVYEIIDKLINFIKLLIDLRLTNTEFTLLSILTVIQYGK